MCLQILILFFYQLMAEERGLMVDVTGFNIAMDEARERSRNAQNKVVGCYLVFPIFSNSVVIYMKIMKRKINTGNKRITEKSNGNILL